MLLTVGRGQLRCQGLGLFPRSAELQHHRGPALRQGVADGSTDATRGPGDQSGLTRQAHEAPPPTCCWAERRTMATMPIKPMLLPMDNSLPKIL